MFFVVLLKSVCAVANVNACTVCADTCVAMFHAIILLLLLDFLLNKHE